MITKTETVEDRKDLAQIMELLSDLSDKTISRVKGYIECLREEEIDAEIAALKAKHGTTPNAETQAAIDEALNGKCKKFSDIELLMADLHDENNS